MWWNADFFGKEWFEVHHAEPVDANFSAQRTLCMPHKKPTVLSEPRFDNHQSSSRCDILSESMDEGIYTQEYS